MNWEGWMGRRAGFDSSEPLGFYLRTPRSSISEFTRRQQSSMKLLSFARRNAFGVVAVLVMVCSIFYSGLIKPVGARDVDARYFYVAAKCWASGESPYDATRYNAMYRATFNSEPDALFVAYLPTLMPAILPMAPLDWWAAARLFAALNFAAAMLLLWASYKLVRELLGTPLRPMHWSWLTLGITIGGVSGTISTGQTSVLIASACALALLGCRLQNRSMVIAGTIIASAKPHLSAPILLFIFLFEPSQRKSMFIAGGVILAFIAYAAALDGNFLANYLGAIKTYSAMPNNDPKLQIGLGSYLANAELSPLADQVLSVAVLAISLTLAGVLRRRGDLGERGSALALTLIFFSIGIVHPIQGYDVCIYAMGISLCSMLSRRMQFMFLAPAILLWRPTLLSKAIPVLTTASIADLGWLMLLTGCIYSAGRMISVRSITTD
jgi:Glycosyltransferase family 87